MPHTHFFSISLSLSFCRFCHPVCLLVGALSLHIMTIFFAVYSVSNQWRLDRKKYLFIEIPNQFFLIVAFYIYHRVRWRIMNWRKTIMKKQKQKILCVSTISSVSIDSYAHWKPLLGHGLRYVIYIRCSCAFGIALLRAGSTLWIADPQIAAHPA